MKVTDKYVLFWDGPFSNWHPSPMTYLGNHYPDSETAFMWCKAMFFGDTETAEKILKCNTPGAAKSYGRIVKNYIDSDWNRVRFIFMVNVLLHKFMQNEDMFQELMKYPGKSFVEASPYDRIWGIGLVEDDPKALDESTWEGQNLLGIALDVVREQLTS